MRNMTLYGAALAALLAFPGVAAAGGTDVGGYFRVMARPGFQGGDGKLGYWNLYGRLMNEGPYAALEMRWDILEPQAASNDVWTSLHAKVEGGSITAADAGNGSLDRLRLSQVYVKAGNVLFRDVTWQVGTLDTWFGSLGLYDMWPARIFQDTVGISARYQTDRADLVLGLGDSGYGIRGMEYDSILTSGGSLRLTFSDHIEVGAGGEYHVEPHISGNRHAPHQTPGMDYEDWVRGEVVERYASEWPDLLDYFPSPEGRNATSWKMIGYLGFGGFGPIRWNNLFASYSLLHPELYTTETYGGQTWTLYVHDFTDQRYQLLVGNEMELVLWPRRLEAVWSVLYGKHLDLDNVIAPSDHQREYYSTVLRLQGFLTPTFHLLAESSVAREISLNGNAWREHKDSIFANTGGTPDTRGLEHGDADTRNTWQGKVGFVVNPLGPGVFTRPSLRILYGAQYSNQNNAFGNAFVEDIDQYGDFENVEQHWHHLLALETEVWF